MVFYHHAVSTVCAERGLIDYLCFTGSRVYANDHRPAFLCGKGWHLAIGDYVYNIPNLIVGKAGLRHCLCELRDHAAEDIPVGADIEESVALCHSPGVAVVAVSTLDDAVHVALALGGVGDFFNFVTIGVDDIGLF